MKPEEVKIGMTFVGVDFSGYWVEVEGIDGPYALCRSFTCFSSSRDKIALTQLVDESLFRPSKR